MRLSSSHSFRVLSVDPCLRAGMKPIRGTYVIRILFCYTAFGMMWALANVGIRRILDHERSRFSKPAVSPSPGRERDHRREMVDDRVGEEANGQLYDHCVRPRPLLLTG